MRRSSARLVAALLIPFMVASPVASAAPRQEAPVSGEAILGWINQYRLKREPQRLPEVIRQAGRTRCPEGS